MLINIICIMYICTKETEARVIPAPLPYLFLHGGMVSKELSSDTADNAFSISITT